MKTHKTTVTPLFRTRVAELIRRVIRGRHRESACRPGNNHVLARSSQAAMACAAAWAVLAGTAGAAETSPKEPDPLAIKLSATVSAARNEVTVRARVEPDARSRELVIEWVSDDLAGGSHLIALEGDRAAASHRYTLKHLTPGQYVVTAILRRNDGTETRRQSELWVVGMGQSFPGSSGATQGSAGGMLRPATQP